jgi:hypothetical protein
MVSIIDRHFPKSRHLGFDLATKSCSALGRSMPGFVGKARQDQGEGHVVHQLA